MIIQIRGTSGSGKSTVMRKVMEGVSSFTEEEWHPEYSEGRKKPLYYRMGGLVVLGHYESACGGCDTIGSAPQVFDLINSLNDGFQTILCEGLLLSEDTKWSSQMKNLRVVFLATPLDVCLRQIEGRRAEAGNEKPLNPANTANRVDVIERARVKLNALGVYCRRASASQAPGLILNWLGCTPTKE